LEPDYKRVCFGLRTRLHKHEVEHLFCAKFVLPDVSIRSSLVCFRLLFFVYGLRVVGRFYIFVLTLLALCTLFSIVFDVVLRAFSVVLAKPGRFFGVFTLLSLLRSRLLWLLVDLIWREILAIRQGFPVIPDPRIHRNIV